MAPQQWQNPVTLDLLLKILSTSLFHPFVAWMLPLSFRATNFPYNSPQMRYSIYWATLVTLIDFFNLLDSRFGYGKARKIDLEEEVIVITGGASGLGLTIAEVYGMRGASVAVLDVKELEGAEERGVRWYRCDVGNREEVERVRGLVEKDVCILLSEAAMSNDQSLRPMAGLHKHTSLPCSREDFLCEHADADRLLTQLGPPTILINNAAIVSPGSITSLSTSTLASTLATNTLSHYHTLSAFLPSMKSTRRGTIVTVSSVLSTFAPAHLSLYAASKAALNALHTSLTAELAYDGFSDEIKTILVSPGQMGTGLFGKVMTPRTFFAPVVGTQEVAREVVKMVDRGLSGEVRMPAYSAWSWTWDVLPVGVRRAIRAWSGIDRASVEGFGSAEEK